MTKIMIINNNDNKTKNSNNNKYHNNESIHIMITIRVMIVVITITVRIVIFCNNDESNNSIFGTQNADLSCLTCDSSACLLTSKATTPRGVKVVPATSCDLLLR